MNRAVILISLLIILTSFINLEKQTQTIPETKVQKTIELLYYKNLYFIRVKLNDRDANLLVDTGAAASLLDINQASDYKFKFRLTENHFAGVGGLSNRYRVFDYAIDHDSTALKMYPYGANLKHIVESFHEGGIDIVGVLGSDFLKTNEAVIDYKNKQLTIQQ